VPNDHGIQKDLGTRGIYWYVAYVRVKKLKGREYAYLVESRWDPEAKTSRQRIVRYLGPASEVTIDAIPVEYRSEDVAASVLRHSEQGAEARAKIATLLKTRLLKSILENRRAESMEIGGEGVRSLGLDMFYVDVVAPVMHEVGFIWKNGEIGVSQEHLATNIVTEVVDGLNSRIRWTGRRRGLAAVCVPDGEEHSLTCRVLRGLLLKRGYDVLDISGPAPTESVADFVARKGADVILVSLTIRQYLPAARRLVSALRERLPAARIVVGGQGVSEKVEGAFPPNTKVIRSDTLPALDEIAISG
jgi:methanogenic corrinoid protein MtbC1